jgi:hypothetical protein
MKYELFFSAGAVVVHSRLVQPGVHSMKRAVLYLRVSTLDQTTANQERELRSVASRMGCDIVHVYKDHGISGAKGRDKRPAFDRLCQDAAQRKSRGPGFQGGRIPGGSDSRGVGFQGLEFQGASEGGQFSGGRRRHRFFQALQISGSDFKGGRSEQVPFWPLRAQLRQSRALFSRRFRCIFKLPHRGIRRRDFFPSFALRDETAHDDP